MLENLAKLSRIGFMRSLHGVLTWPIFSLTSGSMISDLVRQGILPKTVIDVGANIGQFAVAASKLFGSDGVSVHSFEPNPDCVPILRRNVKSLSGVSVRAVALGKCPGLAALKINAHSHSSSLLSLAGAHVAAFPTARELRAVEVPVTTLDIVFDEMPLIPPILLKLDVQGYEAHVLNGGKKLLKRVDYVVLEASFKAMYKGESLFLDLVRLMKDMGFIFCRPVGMLADPETGEVLQADVLFKRAELVN